MKTEISPVFREIRNLRNISIGHPTKLELRKDLYYGYISRDSLSKNGFKLSKTDGTKKKDQFINVEIIDIILRQSVELKTITSSLVNYLKERDMKHKELYKEQKMLSIFPESMNYYFEKVREGIHNSSYGKVDFAISMLGLVKKSYDDFKRCMTERNEFGEYLEYDWNQYNHAIIKVNEYLMKQNNLLEIDAEIYLFYLREEHKRFVSIAKEIDKEYEE